MPIKVLMPALSPTMTEGKLARWLKTEGQDVKSGDVIAEIETDKATMEVEAVDEGKMGKILVPEGTEKVPVNKLIAVLLEEGEDPSEIASFLSNDNQGATKPAAQASAAAASAPAITAAAPPAPQQQATGARIFASPLARRIAKDHGVDLSSVRGSGPRGRIVKADVLSGGTKAPAVSAPRAVAAAPAFDVQKQANALGMAFRAEPNSGVRKVIAKRLLESKVTIPHYYLSVDCELDRLLDTRRQVNEMGGSKLSVNDFIVKAAALALRKVPAVNASWTEDAILHYERVDVSVAVATDNGLITPIVKNTDVKSVKDISAEVRELALRAREGKLRPEEFQGGTITISNLGMFGIKEFSAIINPPQSCILAIGAGELRPIVREGKIEIATVMTCTGSFDHRSVDGAVGAEFLSAFKKLIENPAALLV